MVKVKISGTLIGSSSKTLNWDIEQPTSNELIEYLKISIPEKSYKIIDENNRLKPFINVYVNDQPLVLNNNTKIQIDDEILIIGSIAGG